MSCHFGCFLWILNEKNYGGEDFNQFLMGIPSFWCIYCLCSWIISYLPPKRYWWQYIVTVATYPLHLFITLATICSLTCVSRPWGAWKTKYYLLLGLFSMTKYFLVSTKIAWNKALSTTPSQCLGGWPPLVTHFNYQKFQPKTKCLSMSHCSVICIQIRIHLWITRLGQAYDFCTVLPERRAWSRPIGSIYGIFFRLDQGFCPPQDVLHRNRCVSRTRWGWYMLNGSSKMCWVRPQEYLLSGCSRWDYPHIVWPKLWGRTRTCMWL